MRIVRKTSVDAYNEIKAKGLLTSLRFEVYECLYRHGPMTQMEACLFMGARQDRSYMPRFAELKRMGVIEEVGTKKCTVTGRNVLSWDVTSELPRPLKKSTKRSVKVEDLRSFLAVINVPYIYRKQVDEWMGLNEMEDR